MLWVFGKLLWFALKVSWSLTKIILICMLFPLALIGMFILNLVIVVFPILIIGAIVVMFLKSISHAG